MRMPKSTLILASLAMVSLAMIAHAESDSKGDVAAVRAAGKEYVTKLSRGDVDAVRKMWTRDGDYVDAAGQRTKASELFSGQAAAKSSGSVTSDTSTSESTIRIVVPGVAIEDGAMEGEASNGRFTAVWVKQDGCWRIDSLREYAGVPSAAAATAEGRLQSLAWLIGEWAGKTDDSVILVSSRWSDDGHYIVRELAERSAGGAVTATQRIGWDGPSGAIKSWTFDSQGNTSIGTWRHVGNRWTVDTSETLPGNIKVTTSSVYLPSDEGRFVWEAAGTKIDGNEVPRRRVEFKRAVEK